MTRGAGKISRTVKKPSRKATKPQRATKAARKAAPHTPSAPSIDDLQKQLDLCTLELNEARQREAAAAVELREAFERQAAASDMLGLISGSPGALEPVFSAILEKATRLCGATFGTLYLHEGNGVFRNVAFHNAPSKFVKARKREPLIRPPAGTGFARAAATRQVVHIEDVLTEESDQSPFRLELGRIRTLLIVPMVRDSDLVGAVALYRHEVRPFADKQIELVENFAAQAVIAIENTRLLNELRQRTHDLSESLEQQTATSEVLGVISGSPGQLEPVFRTVLANATRLCQAKFGILNLRDGDAFRVVAFHNPPTEFADRRGVLIRPHPESGLAHIARTKLVSHINDLRTQPHYLAGDPAAVALADRAGARTVLIVPMLKENKLVGAIGIYRQEVRPFTDTQIELLKNFAAQAVIAIENARLLRELRESLEQQTATSEVLQVISSSQGDLERIFETLLENAVRICGANFGNLVLAEGECFRIVALFGAPQAFVEQRRREPVIRPQPGSDLDQIRINKKIVHTADMRVSGAASTALVKLAGARTFLNVPMLKDNELVGTIGIYRQEVKLFTDKQIELVQNFASQAVIAIDSARLLNELRERTDDLSQSLEDLRTTQDRLVQTEKLASLGQLTAGIAHEIKNPLNFVNNFSGISTELIRELQEALQDVSLSENKRAEITGLTDTLRSNLDKIVRHGQRADAIVRNMLLHSRQGSAEHRPVDINALVEESLNLAYHGGRAEKQDFNIALERSFDPEAGEVDVFPQEITRVLLNLISNGFYATSKRKSKTDADAYEPTLAVSTKNLSDRVEIRIRDNGTGIPPEVKEQIFNPFFTTKPAGEGTGLGLSISHDVIVKQHGGSIEVDSEPGAYTEIKITLPRLGVFPTESTVRA